MPSIAVVGAGAWGTALANTFAETHSLVLAWDRNPIIVEEINQYHTNRLRLGNIALRKNLKATLQLRDILSAKVLVLAIPAQTLREVCQEIKEAIAPDTILVIAAKGIEKKTGYLMSQVIQDILPDNPAAVLSGPNFAKEMAAGLPAASTIFASLSLLPFLTRTLSTRSFRLYTSSDLIGGQLGGALKNVVAIAAGIVEGLRLGENARASLVTRGLHEMISLGKAMGAETETFYGLAGMGDLILTSMGTLSRNFKFGCQLAQGNSLEVLLKEFITVEGYETAASIKHLTTRYQVDMPIAETLYGILYENLNLDQAVEGLLNRPLKQEWKA